jgi:hypothetical protein
MWGREACIWYRHSRYFLARWTLARSGAQSLLVIILPSFKRRICKELLAMLEKRNHVIPASITSRKAQKVQV